MSNVHEMEGAVDAEELDELDDVWVVACLERRVQSAVRADRLTAAGLARSCALMGEESKERSHGGMAVVMAAIVCERVLAACGKR